MKKFFIIFLMFFLFTCGSSKPSWERKEKPKYTQNDHAVLGVLFSTLVLFCLHTFTTPRT